MFDQGPWRGRGRGGFSPPTFLEILKSYWEKGIFSLPTLSHQSAPPHFQGSSAGPIDVCLSQTTKKTDPFCQVQKLILLN